LVQINCGESVGEKLKRVVKGDFETLDEARCVIILHRKVFEEFYYI